jgi:hypothetical protein
LVQNCTVYFYLERINSADAILATKCAVAYSEIEPLSRSFKGERKRKKKPSRKNLVGVESIIVFRIHGPPSDDYALCTLKGMRLLNIAVAKERETVESTLMNRIRWVIEAPRSNTTVYIGHTNIMIVRSESTTFAV